MKIRSWEIGAAREEDDAYIQLVCHGLRDSEALQFELVTAAEDYKCKIFFAIDCVPLHQDASPNVEWGEDWLKLIRNLLFMLEGKKRKAVLYLEGMKLSGEGVGVVFEQVGNWTDVTVTYVGEGSWTKLIHKVRLDKESLTRSVSGLLSAIESWEVADLILAGDGALPSFRQRLRDVDEAKSR